VADELLAQQKALLGHLDAERAALSALSGGEVVAAVEAWLRRAWESGRFDPSRPLLGQGAELDSQFAEEADARFAEAFGDDRAPLMDTEGPMPGNTEGNTEQAGGSFSVATSCALGPLRCAARAGGTRPSSGWRPPGWRRGPS
jgi:hypothetical protein